MQHTSLYSPGQRFLATLLLCSLLLQSCGYSNFELYNESPASTNQRNQHELSPSQRAAQAKPANELAQPAAPSQAIVSLTPAHPPSLADKAPLGIVSQNWLTQGGHPVRFMHQDGQWWASVRERIGMFFRKKVLSVACQGHGDVAKALATLQTKSSRHARSRIHVLPGQKPNSQMVYIGPLGLQGGGNGAGEASGSGEPQDEPLEAAGRQAVNFFVGREQELDTFRKAFQANQERIIAPPITGPGGIGKTQLALSVVQQQEAATTYAHVFWIPAESEEKLLEAYRRIAEDLDIYIFKKDLKQAAKTVRAYLENQHCLYVFDDAPDIAVIRDYLPREKGHVLITSRNSNLGAWPTQPLLMNPFNEQEALALAQAFGYGQSSLEQETLKCLLEHGPCYPLTLAQLFSTLQAKRWEAGVFLEAMQEYTTAQEQKLIALLNESPHARIGYAQSIVSVFQTSLEQLAKEPHGEKALQLIKQLAYLDPKGIPLDWLLNWDREDTSLLKRKTRAVLLLLEKYSLIKWDRPTKKVCLHAETQLLVRHLSPQDTPTGAVSKGHF